MFDIGWGELLVIGVVALIVIGPKELPGVLRALGQWTGKLRRMASDFQGQFQEAIREAEMTDLKKEVDQLSDTARGLSTYNPLEDHNLDGLAPKPEKTAAPVVPTATASSLPEPDIGNTEAPKSVDEGRGP